MTVHSISVWFNKLIAPGKFFGIIDIFALNNTILKRAVNIIRNVAARLVTI